MALTMVYVGRKGEVAASFYALGSKKDVIHTFQHLLPFIDTVP